MLWKRPTKFQGCFCFSLLDLAWIPAGLSHSSFSWASCSWRLVSHTLPSCGHALKSFSAHIPTLSQLRQILLCPESVALFHFNTNCSFHALSAPLPVIPIPWRRHHENTTSSFPSFLFSCWFLFFFFVSFASGRPFPGVFWVPAGDQISLRSPTSRWKGFISVNFTGWWGH